MSNYRIEIDGLRALAVIPVIFYHVSDRLVSHGYLGVDVFFVISGYLITSIISEQIHNGSFSLYKFYLRRARRILPAAYLVLLLSFIIGFFVLLPSDLRNLSQALVSIIGFGANIFFYFEVDYFNHFANNNPLLHYWSLSLEEQFYFVMPAVYLIIGKYKNALNFALLMIFFGSIYVYYFNLQGDNQLAFYSLHTRTWQLTIGALVARVRPLSSESPCNEIIADIISLLCLCFIATAYFGILNFFLGSSELLISLAVATLLLVIRDDSLAFSFLRFKYLTQLGLLSYSLYLIHNPIFEFIEYAFDLELESKVIAYKIYSILLILFLARLCYIYVESPLRDQRNITNKVAMGGLVFLSITLLSFGLIGHRTRGFETFKSYETELLVDEEYELSQINRLRKSITNKFNAKGGFKIKVFGDSFAQDVYFSLCHNLIKVGNYDYSLELLDFDDPLYCNSLDPLENGFEADLLIFSNYWQEDCYKGAINLINELSKTQQVFFVTSSAYPRMKSLSILKSKKRLDFTELESYAYQNQRWDRLKTSEKIENNLEPTVHIINRSEFFSGLDGDTVNIFNYRYEPLIWDNAHLTSRAYSDYGKFLFSKIESHIEMSSL